MRQKITTRDYGNEMNKAIDPLVRSRFAAVTRRQDLFKEQPNDCIYPSSNMSLNFSDNSFTLKGF